MASKRQSECALPAGKRKCTIDYNRCVICQEHKDERKTLNIQRESWIKLKTACEARQDKTGLILMQDMDSESWIAEKKPIWHAGCRNWYILEKSYLLAKKKRLSMDSNDTTSLDDNSEENPSQKTRSSVETYQSKVNCIICNKRWHKGKEPSSKITSKNSQLNIEDLAKKLNRRDILFRLVGKGHDMVANDVCYHTPCMNAFKASRIPTQVTTETKLFQEGFNQLTDELEMCLFVEMNCCTILSLRDKFRAILHKLGIKNAENYRSSQLKSKLQDHFGDRIVTLDQSGKSSGFICAATLPLGDAMAKLRELEKMSENELKQDTIYRAAKLLREDAKLCKKEALASESIDISTESAAAIVPDSFYNFACSLLSESIESAPALGTARLSVDIPTSEKALLMSQQLLYQVAGVITPLSVGTSYHLYNQTRSKELITLNSRLGQGISYDTLQRKLTSQTATMMQQVEEDGVYIPSGLTANPFTPHMFAMDNLDWKNKTLEGGSFHATTAIIIEQQDTEEPCTTVSVPSNSTRRRTLNDIKEIPSTTQYFVSAKEKQESRSLHNIVSVDNLFSKCDDIADDLLLVWRLGRSVHDDSFTLSVDGQIEYDAVLPGFTTFCADLFPRQRASKIAYLPLIPSSPTEPAVLKEEMTRITAASVKLGNKYTLVTGDQATYELATAIRNKDQDMFANMIILLGGFHQAHNYLKAVLKIMRGCGAEQILVDAGLCLEGTAKKIFGEKADYYQSMHALWILSEAVWRLLWQGFEAWRDNKNSELDLQEISSLLDKIRSTGCEGPEKLRLILENRPHLQALKNHIEEYQQSMAEQPNAIFWLQFLKMADILHRFIFYQREGHWEGHLTESGNMLPFLIAAGHYKYGQQSLPLYIHEMKQLPNTAPDVHRAFVRGAFVSRRSDGRHNAVSPDMLLEQTYNADAKEDSGLGGITQNEAARTKWVYTKSVTAAVSSKLKSMLHLNADADSPHHEAGETRVKRNADMVINVMTAIDVNPFQITSEHLINIKSGQNADPQVQKDLTNVEDIGMKALTQALTSDKKSTAIVKLKTFHSQSLAKNSTKKGTSNKCDEVSALLRMTQIMARGGSVDVTHFIGNHECSSAPPSLFDDEGNMRSTGSKSTLIKAILEKTNVQALAKLPQRNLKTAVVVDAMHMIRKLSFLPNETFAQVADRFLKYLLKDEAQIVHFCCDRYREMSLKSDERSKRKRSGQTKVNKEYDITGTFKTPDPAEFFDVSQNKARLQAYLCDKWASDEVNSPSLGSRKLYLGGGFCEESKSVVLTQGLCTNVPHLQSTQEEADTRLILHALHSVQYDGAKRIIVIANDTDVIVLLIYYASKMKHNFPDLWVMSATESYLPIHLIAESLGNTLSFALPFIHSLSGRDTTSYPFFTSKKGWLSTSSKLDISAIAVYGENEDIHVSDKLMKQAKRLLVAVQCRQVIPEDEIDLAQVRATKFLHNKSVMLRMLPATEGSFHQHLLRSALAVLIDKQTHVTHPALPEYHEFGWMVRESFFVPVMSLSPLWPVQMEQALSCNCKKGCRRNCPCAKREVPCYIGCKCTGISGKCKMAYIFNDGDGDSD